MKPSKHLLAFELLINGDSGSYTIAADKINFVEVQRNYLQINADGKGYLVKQRLAQIESQLDPATFVRIDSAYLLNLGCINSIRRGIDGHQVMLDDGSCVPVSQRGYKKLRGLIG